MLKCHSKSSKVAEKKSKNHRKIKKSQKVVKCILKYLLVNLTLLIYCTDCNHAKLVLKNKCIKILNEEKIYIPNLLSI